MFCFNKFWVVNCGLYEVTFPLISRFTPRFDSGVLNSHSGGCGMFSEVAGLFSLIDFLCRFTSSRFLGGACKFNRVTNRWFLSPLVSCSGKLVVDRGSALFGGCFGDSSIILQYSSAKLLSELLNVVV